MVKHTPEEEQPVIDGLSTTRDWQRADTSIAVLPMGSVEQHGGHLPLLTDALAAEFYGRALAADLGAVLLPTMPYGTCFEHAGFRGSFTLRPETYMAIVRDLADEIEKQDFTRLVIVNGHGGNFSLKPVVRDINRQDRRLKIILVNPWEFDDSEEGRAPGGDEVHAGASETSRFLAIHPELVRLDRVSPPAAGVSGARQSDLDTFGVGTLRPDGIWGSPADASREAGERIVAGIKANLRTYVIERLQWLEADPRYAGEQPIQEKKRE